MVWNTMRDRERYRRRKEGTRAEGEGRDSLEGGWRSKIELERNEREVLGAVC